MSDGIFARMLVELPAKGLAGWERAPLSPERARLRGTKGFDALDMGDEDLLGWEMTVAGAKTLDEALSIARGFVAKKDVARWAHFVDEQGRDAVRVEQDGPLPRSATNADLLALLARLARDGEQFLEVDVRRDAGQVAVRGVLSDYDTYRAHRLPWLYAVSSAVCAGGTGSLTLLGESEGEFVATFADAGAGASALTIQEVDPQNLTEEDWEERLGGVEALQQAFAAWARERQKRRRRGAR
jgi:hypothetical protein